MGVSLSNSAIKENKLPKGWVRSSLNEVCHIEMGQSPPSESYNINGQGLPFFQGKAEFTELYPVARKWCTSPTKIAKQNDILLSVRAPVGSTNLASTICSIGRGLAALCPYKGVEHRYILYAMRYWSQDLVNQATGTTFESVTSSKVNSFPILIPPSNEQKRIVAKIEELFSKLDAGIAALERVQTNLKRYRASVLKAAVEGKLTEEWRKQNPNVEPASKLLQRILSDRRQKWEADQLEKYQKSGKTPPKDWQSKYKEPATPDTQNLPTLPDSWCWATVEQVSEVGTGTTPLRTNNNFWKDGLIPWVTSTMVNKLLVTEASDFVTPEALEKTTLKLYPRHTLILAMYGEGKTRGKVSELMIEATINQALAALQVSENFIDLRKYLKLFLQGQYESMRSSSAGGVQPNLNLGIVQQICIPLPPLPEQVMICENAESIISVIEKTENLVCIDLKRSSRLRQSILKQAFTGKLAPQDPNDEPASQLLESIQKEKATEAKPAKRQRKKSDG